MPQTTCRINYKFWSEFTPSLSTASGSLSGWTGTSAIDTKGSTLERLPMERESIFCRRRVRRCFWAFLFVKNNAARIKLSWTPRLPRIPNRFKMTFTTNARATEMFSVRNGIVLIMLEEVFDGCGVVEWEKNLAMISDTTMEAAVRLADIIKWKYTNTNERDPWSSFSIDTSGVLSGTQCVCAFGS